MTGIIMPEIVIYKALNAIVDYLRKDLKKNEADESKSMLYKLLGQDEDGNAIQMNRYNYFKQAKKIFLNPQNLSVNIGYNFEVAKLVSFHIILPSETPSGSAIGEDEGSHGEYDEDGNFQPKFTQMFSSTYQIMLTADNSSEMNVVYHVIKAMLIAIVPHLSLMGLMNPTFSGNDIVFQDDLMPQGIFHRVININFTYELTVPQLIMQEAIKGIVFEGHLLENINDSCPNGCDNRSKQL